jgi:hypothetical protein
LNILYIHGIKVQVISDDNSLSKFIKKSFPYFQSEVDTTFKLDVTLKLNEIINPDIKSINLTKIGNGVFLSSKKLLLCSGLYIYEVFKEKNRLSLIVYTQDRESLYGKTKLFIKYKLLATDYYYVVRHAIILPVLWILSRYFNIFTLHGSAVEINGSGYSFAGLAGIGKSILSIYYAMDEKNKFLSDNYLLYDENYIYPFPEWIRIVDKAEKMLPNMNDFLCGSEISRYGKKYYQIPNDSISSKIKPKILLFPQLGNKTSLSQINDEIAMDRIILSKNHVREFPEHTFVGLLDYFFEFTNSKYEFEMKVLKIFLEKNDIYTFTLDKKLSLDKNNLFLMNEIKRYEKY